ncbi:MAG: hypothetical protein ABID83_05000 [Candidatus Omnitrophota bacterium]
MITKERLLAGLNELVYVEEGMVTLFANFDKVLVNLTEDIDESKKEEIKKLLSTLYRDSARHKETVDDMIRQIEVISRDEY